MGYKDTKRDGQHGFKPKRKDYLDNTTHGYDGKPDGEGEDVKFGLSAKALKDLPHSSYSVMADPYTAALPTSEPYPIINKFNKHVGGSYAGDRNIDGGNVQQYANSGTSSLLKAFDEFRLQAKINYRYLPITARTSGNANVGKELVNEMRKSIAEAVSTLQSTTFTQMAINRFAIVTDLPMGDATTTNIAPSGSTAVYAYTNLTDVLYAMSIYYQTFLQNGLNTMNWHNSFRLKQGTAIRNAWNREVPILNSLFGLFNKKAFLSLMDSINLSFEGEYMDLDFAKQASMLNVMPSRRSNSILDPVLELQTSFNKPGTFKVYILKDDGTYVSSTPYFDDAELKLTISGTDVTFWEACENINDYLSLEATQLWARQSTISGAVVDTDNGRYNKVKAYFDVLIKSFNTFKPKWSDYREALDTLTRAGIVRWTKGFRPAVTKDTDAALFQNLVVDDIYKFILGGATDVYFDDATKRWRTFSMWNMYNGIPEYDTKAGGCFLTFSFKDRQIPTDSDANIKYLPVLFEKEVVGGSGSHTVCVACSRDGYEAKIETSDVTMASNKILCRLAPLTSQSSLKLRVPMVKDTSQTATLTNEYISYIQKALTQLIGYCGILKSSAYDYSLDPDIISIYQVEIEDITNMAITYARAMGPIRGTTSAEGLLGFFGMEANKKN